MNAANVADGFATHEDLDPSEVSHEDPLDDEEFDPIQTWEISNHRVELDNSDNSGGGVVPEDTIENVENSDDEDFDEFWNNGASFVDVLLKVEDDTETYSLISCNQCPFETKHQTQLKRHIGLVHDGKLFQCDECEFSGKTKLSIKHHKISAHQGGVLHSCELCDYKSSWPRSIKRHVTLVHVEGQSKMYKCEQCDHSSKWKEALQKHVKATHQKIMLNCDQCEYKTSWSGHSKNI